MKFHLGSALPLTYALASSLALASSTAWSQTAADPCDEQATCQAQRGAQLLAQGRVEEAAVALEKALLLDPNLPGAQLDYAQALAQIGLKGSARAMLADVLKRPDIQPTLKSKLGGAQTQERSSLANSGQGTSGGAATISLPTAISPTASSPTAWQWSTLGQASLGHETNLNSATFTDALTLMLSNGPVTIGLSDSAKPISGPAAKTLLAVQGSTRAGSGLLALGELSVSASLSSKGALQSDSLTGIKPERNQTAEAVAKYSLPMIAGAASGQWQFTAGGTQFWLSSTSAYSDTGYSVKFNWDRSFEPSLQNLLGGVLGLQGQAKDLSSCKLAPSVGQTHQNFPLSSALNGIYSFARVELLCKGEASETQLVLGKGSDKAQNKFQNFGAARPGGDKQRQDMLLRHERLLQLGQLSAWLRYAKSKDADIYSELLGDLKTTTHRTDWGVSFWVPLDKSWSAGLNLEATSQRSNNTLFNLKNSGVYAGIRWSEN